MKALVTGGAGFIGSHLTELLLEKNVSVALLDNLSSGRLSNLRNVENHPRFSFYQADICDLENCLEVFKKERFDWVFHLAALADVIPSIENPENYFNVNVKGTFNILECAKKTSVKRFLYAASASCYGTFPQIPTNEKARISTEHPYGLTKYLGEEMVLHWEKVFRLPALSLRLFNVFGPRSQTKDAYGAVFGVFLAQKWHKMPFTVVGDGKQIRDFIYVTDVAQAFLMAAESRFSGEIFNVGSMKETCINDLVRLLKGDVVYLPKRPNDPSISLADTSKIQKKLGWQAKTSLEEGVSHLLQVLDDYKEAPLWDPETIEKATAPWFHYLNKDFTPS